MSSKVKQHISDDILKDGQPSDIVIPVMGPTGAGKSSFINHVLGGARMEVGHNLASQTKFLAPVVIDNISNFPMLRGCRLILVDTPGFDDTYVEDVDVLRRIAKWLGLSYKKNMVLGGVLYLHDISQDRFAGTARRNLEMFTSLCGDVALDKVVLATTKWERLTPESGVNGDERETELKTEHWKTMIDKGSQLRRFGGDSASAWDILNVFLKRVGDRRHEHAQQTCLQIQHELVISRKLIPQTEAGKQLRVTLEEVLEEQRKDAAQTHWNAKHIVDQIEVLKAPSPSLFRKLLGRYPSEVDDSV